MAVRFSASTHLYTATLSLGSQANMCVCCWMNIAVDRNAFSTFWNIDNGGSSSSVRGIQTTTNGVTVEPYTVNGGMSGTKPSLTVGTWYYFAVNLTGNNASWRWRTDASATVTAGSLTGASDALTATRLRLGDSAWGGEWLNGSLAAVKIWTGNLSSSEMDAEALTYAPVRTTGLVSWYPFHEGPETTDYSGNGRNLTGGTGTAFAANPSTPQFATTPSFQGWGVPIK